MTIRFAAACFCIAALAAAPVWAQAPAPPKPAPAPTAVPAAPAAAQPNELEALKAAAKVDKRALVAKTLELTPQEEKKFWPVYDTYQRHLDSSTRKFNRAVEDLVVRDKPVSDAFAKQLVTQFQQADEAELKARAAMQKGVLKALPPKKAARYLQLESKLRAIYDYDVAAGIPLVK